MFVADNKWLILVTNVHSIGNQGATSCCVIFCVATSTYNFCLALLLGRWSYVFFISKSLDETFFQCLVLFMMDHKYKKSITIGYLRTFMWKQYFTQLLIQSG
jgi:hypothetical protein